MRRIEFHFVRTLFSSRWFDIYSTNRIVSKITGQGSFEEVTNRKIAIALNRKETQLRIMDNNDTQMNGPKRAKKRYGSRPIAFIALATSIEIEKKGGFCAESIYFWWLYCWNVQHPKPFALIVSVYSNK